MKPSRPLAIESFSYSWLSNVEPPLDGIDELLRTSLDSFSPEAISKELAQKNFNFDIPASQSSSSSLLHADELFSDGLIKPLSAGPSIVKPSCTSSDMITAFPAGSSFCSRNVLPALLGRYRLLSKWRISSKKILLKCFGYLRSHCHKLRGSRKSSRVDDKDMREWEVKSWCNSPQASPESSVKYSTGDWCDIENSIYEAILHCKRSVEK